MTQYVYEMYRVGKIVPPKRQILKDISLSFLPGAKIGVLGLNGAGKSTVLRIMAGVETDHEGDAKPMPGISIGYLEQEPKLDKDKTVRETVEEGLGEILIEARHDAQQRRLAGAVEAEHADLRARQKRQPNVLQHLAPAGIGLGETFHDVDVLIGGHRGLQDVRGMARF